jgi:hypothetical protein
MNRHESTKSGGITMELTGGRTTLDEALAAYDTAWKKLITDNELEDFAESAIATTIGWKVADKHALFENMERLAGTTQQVHIGTVNGRFIASVVLKEPYHGMYVIKILERRAGSDDPLGLDSVDYLVQNPTATYDRLSKARGCLVAKESNDNHAWLSLRFGDTREYEAKFVDHIVLKVAQQELAEREQEILVALGVA